MSKLPERSDIQAVKTLAVPSKDTKRDFAGLQTLKMDKKDRHMQRLRDFAKFLEESSEVIIQEVSTLGRDIREGLEVEDESFVKFYKTLEDYDFLIVKSEDDLLDVLGELRNKIANRSLLVETYAKNVSNTENKRADIVGTELKRLVDDLIAISHQLPDDIEHIVEDESYELNTEIVKNRKVLAAKIGTLRIAQVKLEAEALQKWEESRAKWRQIRHEKGLNDFSVELSSTAYTDPGDRQHYMKRFRLGQEQRQQAMQREFSTLLTFSADNIDSEKVQAVQSKFSAVNDQELGAIKSLYNGISDLRSNLAYKARERVEALRSELHLYGALKLEPEWRKLSSELQTAVDDESLAELWRLGGGLKSEIQGIIQDVQSPEIIYDRLVESVLTRIDSIVSGFSLKAVLKEKGRLAQLEKCRGLIAKMRTSPRAEVAGVLRSLVPEIEEVSNLEGIDDLFKTQVLEISAEITQELLDLDQRIASDVSSTTSRGGTGSVSGTGTVKTGTPKGGASVRSGATGRTGSTGRSGKTGTSSALGKDIDNTPSVDAATVKMWNRTLGILFYGSDLPENYQVVCVATQQAALQQRECNTLVDDAVFKQSDFTLRRLDRDYQRVIDSIITYLEAQANSLAVANTNMGDYYLKVAKLCEKHRKEQKVLDEKSADEFWDIKEQLRFDLEDREKEYETACQKIRESTQAEVLKEHFEEVLVILNNIQQEYRNYHAKGCFIADKYPLLLIDEFASHLREIASTCFFTVGAEHTIIKEYERVFNECVRLNQQHFEADPLAAGVSRVETLPIADILGGEEVLGNTETFDSPHVVNNAGVPPETVYSGKYYFVKPLDEIVSSFNVDGAFAPPDPVAIAEAEAAATAAAVASGETGGGEDGGSGEEKTSQPASAQPSEAAAKLLRRKPHDGCAYMAADTPVTLPLPSPEELDVLKEEDSVKFEDFENAVVKGFLPLSAEKVADMEAQKEEQPEVQEAYDQYLFIRDMNKRLKEERAAAADPSVVLASPPQDCNGNLWVAVIRIGDSELSRCFSSIRNSMCASLETESFKRILTAEKSTKNRKTEYTDELEERVRNHWPRRGRVETQIKQPREAELLSHKEKTWRHIQSIQEKMIDLQGKFDESVLHGQQECDNYVNEMATLRNSLSDEGFKNLASLQGVDCKARGFTLSFQEESVLLIKALVNMSDHQTDSVVAYARDFRKICPPQQPGVEGGYSESEISEISNLVEGQVQEILDLAEEWRAVAAQLKEQQEQSLKSQDEFSARYEKAVQDLSMAEGLGQKYGAPRRRAQERLRTEVGRDEQSAGKVDELLAKLEFIVAEKEAELQQKATRLAAVTENGSSAPNSPMNPLSNSDTAAGLPSGLAGRVQALASNEAWALLMQVRISLQRRAVYLRVLDADAADANIGGTISAAIQPLYSNKDSLPWVPVSRMRYFVESHRGSQHGGSQHGGDGGGEGHHAAEEGEDALLLKPLGPMESMPPAPRQTFEEVCAEVDSSCRKETRELYSAEGKADMLGEGDDGVPDSLQAWLESSKDKMLGRHGHREKAWKRLWAQIARSEGVLSRALPNEKPDGSTASATAAVVDTETTLALGETKSALPLITYKLGVPAVCLLAMTESFILFCKRDKKSRWEQFSRLLRVWEQGRAKHERLLRPQLGSPDRADELADLDRVEKERSAELQENVLKLRSVLTRTQTLHLTNFFDDISTCSKSLLLLLDSTLRQQLLQVPPDTAVPKVHMTLKRLRKAQRIRDEVARGGEDKSQIRTWPAIVTTSTIDAIKASEDLVHDLGSQPTDTVGDAPPKDAAAAAATVPDKKAKKGKADSAPTNDVPQVEPTLVRPAWVRRVAEVSAVRALVSSAHRALIDQRDKIAREFTEYYRDTIEELREDCVLILQQEESWSERWARQVDMLRTGSL